MSIKSEEVRRKLLNVGICYACKEEKPPEEVRVKSKKSGKMLPTMCNSCTGIRVSQNRKTRVDRLTKHRIAYSGNWL